MNNQLLQKSRNSRVKVVQELLKNTPSTQELVREYIRNKKFIGKSEHVQVSKN